MDNLLTWLTSAIDSRKRIAKSNLSAPPMDLLNMMGSRAEEASKGLLGDAQATRSVMPQMQDAGYNAMTQKAMDMGLMGITAYHGSPSKFDKFDIGQRNPETGGSSFGSGINLSADPKHAKVYGENLYKVDIPDNEVAKFIKWEEAVPKKLSKQLPLLDMSKPIPFGGGATIEKVDDQWLLKSGNANFKLRDNEVQRMFGGNTGEQTYRRLVASLGGDERAASSWLKDRGYKGIENNTERGARNFVVFDDQLPKIIGRE